MDSTVNEKFTPATLLAAARGYLLEGKTAWLEIEAGKESLTVEVVALSQPYGDGSIRTTNVNLPRNTTFHPQDLLRVWCGEIPEPLDQPGHDLD